MHAQEIARQSVKLFVKMKLNGIQILNIFVRLKEMHVVSDALIYLKAIVRKILNACFTNQNVRF